jgi:serine/threonine protein kinase
MGVVFEARHERLRTTVAVKTLTRDVLGDIAVRERLFREAQALALVDDGGVVRVLDCAEDNRHGPYVVMEMLRGRPLDGILAARQRLSLSDTVPLVFSVARTLSAVHARGVVHRDIKPANLFITRAGRHDLVKLLDFGIALLPQSVPPRLRLTRPGAICGTPEYMAPEQLFARDVVDPRADVFGLAAVTYECLSGRLPFPSDLRERAIMHSRGDLPPMLNLESPSIPLSVARVIDRALSVDPAQRFETVMLFAEALAGVSGVSAGPLNLLDSKPIPMGEVAPVNNANIQGTDPTEIVIDLVQRRRTPRAPYLTPVRVSVASGVQHIDGRSQDISESGMQINLPVALPLSSAVQLRFALPVTGVLVTVQGVVRWCRAARANAHSIGVEFVGAVEEGESAIRRYVAWFGTQQAL